MRFLTKKRLPVVRKKNDAQTRNNGVFLIWKGKKSRFSSIFVLAETFIHIVLDSERGEVFRALPRFMFL